MLADWAGTRPKYKVAEEIILKLMDSVYTMNPNVEFSLRVFGSQSTVPENDCHDTRNEVPFEKGNRQRMELRLDDIKPLGVTSIAYSLKQAALNDLVDVAHNAYSIILVTDGGESCGGNICEVMKMLISNKVFFKPYIIGLEDVPGLQKEYECMGDYLQVTSQGDIPKAIGIIVEAFRPVLKMTKTEYKELQATPKPEEIKKIEPPKVELPKVQEPKPEPPKAEVIKVEAPKVEIPVKKEVPPPPHPTDNISEIPSANLHFFATYIPPQPKLAMATVPAYELALEPAEPPVVKSEPVIIATVVPAKLNEIVVMHPSSAQKMVMTAVPPMPVIELEPVRPAPENISGITPTRLAAVSIASPKTKKLTAVAPPAMPAIEVEIEKPAPIAIDKLVPARMRQFNIMWVMDDRGIVTRAVPPMPVIKVEPPKVEMPKVATSGPSSVPIVPPGMKTMDFTVNIEDAKQTTVEVYFTDGKGKFYSTTPQIILLDKVKKKPVKQFYRTVDASGNPDPQPDVPPGTYDLTFANKPKFVVPNVVVEANKKNKVIIRLPRPTLSFVYAEPGDFGHVANRPVSEFRAEVIERNKVEGGRVQMQKCTEELEYEPGNYHVRINTFPQDIRNIDLDFDQRIITIPQPGFAKFTPGDDRLAVVFLYQRVGDRYLKFHEQLLNDSHSKHLNLQPGEYQAHYQKGPGGAITEKVKPFVVKATETTEVILD
jgi:hypothetical protein